MRNFTALALALLLTGCSDETLDSAPGTLHADDATSDAKLLFPDINLPDIASATGLDASATATSDASDTAVGAWTPLVTARPYKFRVPAQYDPAKAWPLVLLLHGYAESADFVDGWFHFGDHADELGFLLAVPDGTVDATGMRFWNADAACCDLYKSGIDDVAYLTAVLDDMAARFHVDPKRIYVAGHSNGAFMAHRMACNLADRIAAILAVSGNGPKVASTCNPAQPVAVLQVHGTLDTVISYLGGLLPGGAYPSATDSVGAWAQRDGCATTPVAGAAMDLDAVVFGKETAVLRWTGCTAGAAELWSVQGATHFPAFAASWPKEAFGWLQAHARP